MIAHFYRGVTPRCQIVDGHFQKMAPRHVEARFIKIDVEKNPYLVEKLGIIIIPTIVLIKDGKTEHSIRGFDEMGGTDDFSTNEFEYVLAQHGMITYEEDKGEEIKERFKRAGLNSMSLAVRRGEYDDLIDEDD
jgi:thioredoxin-like negative regulator of GroEL